MNTMHLRILLPSRVLADRSIVKLVAEAPNGSFGILPRHVDFAAALVPGVLTFVDADGAESFVGIDEGFLVKRGDQVMISTVDAIEGGDLASLREQMDQRHHHMDDHERSARSALARLEAGIVKRFMEFTESM
jgi:F-type H+-transporting ATPase subunit epsilon